MLYSKISSMTIHKDCTIIKDSIIRPNMFDPNAPSYQHFRCPTTRPDIVIINERSELMIDMCDSTITHSRFFKTVIYYYSQCRSWYFLLNIQFFPPNSFFMRGVNIQANFKNSGGCLARHKMAAHKFQLDVRKNSRFGTTELYTALILKIESKAYAN